MRFLLQLEEACMIHTSKIAVILLFFAAIYDIDALHTGYFILFLVFAMIGERKTERIWGLQLIYNIFLIMVLYLYQIIATYSEITNTYTIMRYLGIKRFDDSLLIAYKEHLILLMVLFVQKLIYESPKYKHFKGLYGINGKEDENEAFLGGKQMDILTKFNLEFGVYVCFVLMVIVVFVPSPNLLCFCYLLFLMIFLIISLFYNTRRKVRN